MKILKSIKIKNYRSIIDEKIDLENMVSIIGANESGKSNILKAIGHIAKDKQNIPFDLHELNLCAAYSDENYIELEFEIVLNDQLIPKLIKDIPFLQDKTVILKKKGTPKKETIWSIILNNIPKTSNLVLISGSKTTFRKQLKGTHIENKQIDHWIEKGYFFSNSESNLTKNPFYDLKQQRVISILSDEEKNKKIEELIIEEVLRNIQVYFWQYNETNYLKEAINLDEFCKSPRLNESVYGIFKIAENERAFHFDLNSTKLREHLMESNATHRSNLLNEISKSFNKIFKKSWRTYFGGDKIDLIIGFEGDNLSFRLYDGRECPPEYRSDGLKWFLTFLINFQSKQKDLSDYILLMDEPGGLLRPQGQKDALNFLLKLSEKNQIVYSTHQTFLIDKNNPQNVRILDRKEKDRKSDFWPTKVHSIQNNGEHILRDSLLRESLGFTLSDISPINENNILVEGTFDRNVIQYCNEHFKIFDFNFCSVISCGKASNIKYQAKHFSENGLKVFCIYDHDSVGKTSCESNHDTENKYKLYISKKDGETIEDVLPDEVFETAFNRLIKMPKFKSEFKKTQFEFNRPFISTVFEKQLMNSVNRDLRQELKHQLEMNMIEVIKKNFDPNAYGNIQSILKSIKIALDLK